MLEGGLYDPEVSGGLTDARNAVKALTAAQADNTAATAALKAKGVKNVLITLGESGAVLDTERDGFFYSPCVDGIMAVDPTAAGDSFVGALSVGLCCGWGYEETLRFANHTAGLTVSALGAMPSLPTLDKVEAFLREKTGSAPDTSVLR